MPVNIEIKGNLARLLATENLIVEHKQVETAQFDTKSRVLTLPMWNTASNYVYDMLVAHEVGHALFTPAIMWKKDEYENIPHAYVNIIEDVRIERLMKQKFAGLNKDFYKGYEELNAQDFFELEGIDINEMKLIDKINLYFKLGSHLCIDFDDVENQFVTEASQAETFDDVLDISKRVYAYAKEQQQKRKEQQQDNQGNGEAESDNNADLDTPSYELDYTDEEENEGEDDIEGDDWLPNDIDESAGSQGAGNWNNIDESDTQQSFDSNSEKLQDKNGRETNYVTIPDLDLDKVVIPFDDVRAYLSQHFNVDEVENDSPYWGGNSIDQEKIAFNEYKKSASKDVNNLVKEFEMKKSADSYARQATSKTGVLDTSKLHTYMFNDDIFKKVTVIPEGKNHGLVFLLDWSGSMQGIIKDTIKQLFNLVWFCRKCNIPFEVYAFSNDAWSIGRGDNTTDYDPYYHQEEWNQLAKEELEGDIYVQGTFRMVNILTSNAKTRDINEMMQLLWLQASAFQGQRFHYAPRFTLSGTPLNEAIIAVGQLTKKLMKVSKLQKCHVIALTDGEGFSASYNAMRQDYLGNSKGDVMGHRGISPWDTVIRVGSKSFLGAINEPEFTCKLVEAVKSTIPNCNFVAIRILDKGSLRSFYQWYGRNHFYNDLEMKDMMRKKGLVSFTSLSFDMWFAMQSKSLHIEDELDVEVGAAKRSITAAFRKMNKSKKTNKFLVKEFIKQIA